MAAAATQKMVAAGWVWQHIYNKMVAAARE